MLSGVLFYNGNGAIGGSTYASEHRYNEEMSLNANGFIRTGYTFKNWNTDSDKEIDSLDIPRE